MDRVAEVCPRGCGETLFLGEGGHVTCSNSACPDPSAVDALLSRPFLESLVYNVIEEAKRRRDLSSGREMSLVVTNLEQAALWLREHHGVVAHEGESAILDWLWHV